MNLATPLFDNSLPAIRTSIAGISNAKYEQLTDGSKEIYKQVLRIFERHKLEYFLFAGAIVGYVRNGRMPPWNDDLDVIIFEDQIQIFENRILPLLRECGYACWPVAAPYTGGGYHILALQQDANSRCASIELADGIPVVVPWAQIDVFYTSVDEAGFIRNLSNWGMYHTKEVPETWVRPGTFIHLDSFRARVFSNYEDDIRHEYGNVAANIVVHSHDKVALKLMGSDWEKFEFDYDALLSTRVRGIPPSLSRKRLAEFVPDANRRFETSADENFDAIAKTICEDALGHVTLTGADQSFWVLDLKRLFPSVKLEVLIGTEREAKRAVHLRRFIDSVQFSDPTIRKIYEDCLLANDTTISRRSGST
ncbi:MAG: LicD family protein [Nitrobacter sp.]|uniref:LicD family protein n=1 Tax=Nitrobacter sp. TaxID=29420 RepID=UPI0026222676|nr:LicD family protein [Nitrobacter sp.]MCV0386563.1 LicD family protein [Nitrobacter sp.]